MTTDKANTSEEGVDVLVAMKVACGFLVEHHCNKQAMDLACAHDRIAELIEAADEVSKVFDGDAALDHRLFNALRSCTHGERT
jgi:hypothetical protein